MAYMRSLDEQNQQQTQQGQQSAPVSSFSGGQTISPEPGKVASSGASANGQPQNGTSSGSWTNISDFLSANPSMGQKAIDQGNSLLGKESSVWGQASDPIKQATKNFSYESMTPDEIDASIRMGSTDKVKRTIQQPAFSGPTSVNYDTNASGNIPDAKQLSNRNTAANVLAKDAIKAGGYGLGLRTLDTSLLGADPNYAQGAPKLWNNVNDFVSKTGQEKSQLEGLSQYDKDKVERSRGDAINALGNERDKYQNNMKIALENAQKQQKDAKNRYLDEYKNWYNNKYQPSTQGHMFTDPVTGKRVSDYNFKYSDLFDKGPISSFVDPSLNNVGTSEDQRALFGLNDLGYGIQGWSGPSNQQWQMPTYGTAQWKQDLDSWLSSPEGKAAGIGSTSMVVGGPAMKEINSGIEQLKSGNVETPEELARRLGLI